MAAQDFDSWRRYTRPLVLAGLVGTLERLFGRSVGDARFGDWAKQAVNGAFCQAFEHETRTGYFRGREEFHRWVLRVALREGMRLCLADEEVGAALRRLSADDARILVMHYTDGLSAEEVGCVVGLDRPEAHRRLHGALLALMEQLRP